MSPRLVWTDAENLARTGIRSPDNRYSDYVIPCTQVCNELKNLVLVIVNSQVFTVVLDQVMVLFWVLRRVMLKCSDVWEKKHLKPKRFVKTQNMTII